MTTNGKALGNKPQEPCIAARFNDDCLATTLAAGLAGGLSGVVFLACGTAFGARMTALLGAGVSFAFESGVVAQATKLTHKPTLTNTVAKRIN